MSAKRLMAFLLCLILCLFAFPTVSAQDEIAPQKEVLYSALYEADIASIQQALSLGLITSEELTAYYLQRISDYNEPYNCFITICDDALEIARQRDAQRSRGEAQGYLFGIPVVIKDNMDLTGYHTTNGYKKEDSQIAKSNADVVQALLDAGAVILAKTNMSTAAQDAVCSKSQVVGETKNAYNTTLASGGSSGGSAVATSLNFAVASLGTDTNSSLRIPAALNGCIALRPTFGFLSNKGIKRLNSTRDTPGTITRTVYDQAIMLDVLTGGQYQYAQNLNKDVLQGLRIGILEELSYATKKESKRKQTNIDEEVADAFAQAVQQLQSLGAEVVPVSIPDLFTLSNRTFSSGDAVYKESLYQAFQDALQKYNVSAVIYPSYLSTPIRSGKDSSGKKWDPYSQVNINNCRTLSPSAGLPEISVPIGVHSLGAGIGMEIAAQKNCEQLLLNIAYAYAENYSHRMAPTGAADAYSQYHQGSLQTVLADYQIRLEQSQEETTQPAIQETQLNTQQPADEPQNSDRILLVCGSILVVLIGLLIVMLIILRRRVRRRKQQTVGVE